MLKVRKAQVGKIESILIIPHSKLKTALIVVKLEKMATELHHICNKKLQYDNFEVRCDAKTVWWMTYSFPNCST